MGSFEYVAPRTLEDAISRLSQRDANARPLAGGTDLLVKIRQLDPKPDLLVDLKRIPELREIEYNGQEGLSFGAAVTCTEISVHDEIKTHYQALADSAGLVGGVAIRNRATIGGNICNSAPSADTVPALIVLDATCLVSGSSGTRVIPAREFCLAPGENALRRGELLVSFSISPPEPGTGSSYLRFIPRGEMDIAVAGAAAMLRLDGDGTIADARIALASVAPVPLNATGAAEFLIGKRPDQATFERAGELAQESVAPIDDVRGSALFRRHLVGVLTRRALAGALARAGEV